MTLLGNDEVLNDGTRVWVWDPYLFGPKSRAGKIIGYTINFPKYMELLDTDREVEYWVDFGDRREWIASYQITGYLTSVISRKAA